MKNTAAMGAALAMAVCGLPGTAHADGGVKVGVLTCNVASGWGFVFGSTRELRCTFTPNGGAVERYAGHIRKFGIDIGYQTGGVIVWGVFAPTTDLGRNALAGEYDGASGSAAVGVGAGANVLFGGFKKSITLQPVSIEGLTGFNVAGGIAQVTLAAQP